MQEQKIKTMKINEKIEAIRKVLEYRSNYSLKLSEN